MCRDSVIFFSMLAVYLIFSNLSNLALLDWYRDAAGELRFPGHLKYKMNCAASQFFRTRVTFNGCVARRCRRVSVLVSTS
jgi:hypothetical protein